MEDSTQLFGGHRFTYFASYIIVLGMMVCLAITMIGFLQWILPTWNASGMVFISILAYVEAIASNWLIRRMNAIQHQMVIYRLTEWAIIIVILKVFSELILGQANFAANFNLWFIQFPENVFNGRFFFTLIPFLAVWMITNWFDNDLFLLGTFETASADTQLKTRPVRNLILRRFLNVGLFIVVLAGIPPQAILAVPQVVASNAAPAAVTYFILGIILLSLTRYSYLSTTWRQSKIETPPEISRRWFFYTALLILALALIIFWLPTRTGMGLFQTLSAIFGFIAQAVYAFYGIVLYLFGLLLSKFIHQTPGVESEIIPTPRPAEALPPVPPAADNWMLIKSILFWVGLLILIFIALRQYILFNQSLSEELKRFRPWRWLALVWKRLTASVKKGGEKVGIFVQSSIKRLRSLGKSPVDTSEWAFINPRRLENRQKVIFYYLALLRRAGEVGLPRQEGQTPNEYANSLKTNLQEGQENVEAMTNSFIEARYSLHEIPVEAAGKVESTWDAIRRILRNLRKAKRDKDAS